MLAFTNLTVDDIEMWGKNELCNGGVRIYWSTDDIGFGTIDIIKTKDNKIVFDDEHMGESFVIKVLETLVTQN